MNQVSYRTVTLQKGPDLYSFQLIEIGEDGTERRLLTEFATEEEARIAQRALRQLQLAEDAARRIGPANEP
ncbi:hypothetical protein [Plastoroseomonas hellenica]|uniref:hypothetical protein n=1 Tax=Plastoroseomonas hellenica TaxID=2687306 RepID=UPI001BA891A6|nr:hypothetical protein [Plastoroseomonas hellenica]MBR0646138.1 hypothetical protein [Plastoroseomonas hellenica]